MSSHARPFLAPASLQWERNNEAYLLQSAYTDIIAGFYVWQEYVSERKIFPGGGNLY